MSKLITARKGYKKPRNGPLFALGVDRVNNNIFDGEGSSFIDMSSISMPTVGISTVNPIPVLGITAPNSLFNPIKVKSGGLNLKGLNSKMQGTKGASAAIGAGATLVGGLLNKGISGGLNSEAGSMVSTLGSTAGNIVGLFNPVAGAAVTLGSQLIGGLTNRAFGMKTNAAALNAANLGTAALNNFISNALTFDDVHGPTAVASVQDAYKGGWFSKRKARRKNAELRALRAIAQSWANRSVDNNVINLRQDQMNNALANYAALGGWLGGIDPTSPIGYSMLTDMEKILQDKVNNKNMSAIPSILAFGGNVESNGATWSDGMTHINVGGSHEENPNEGVQLGVDNQGTPNLVEEGEVIYNDYVFSNRLTVPVIKKKKDLSQEEKVLKKYSDNTYAKAAKKAEKDSGVVDRPNDAIAKRGFEATLEILATSQEREREKEKLQELKEAIDLMSPEELAMLQQQMAASQQQANQQAMAEQQQLMIPQGMELMQYPVEEQQPIAALGGLLNGWNPVNKFAQGGNSRDEDWYNLLPEGFIRWLVDSYNLNDKEDLEKVPSEYQEALKRVYEYALDPTHKDYSLQALWSAKDIDPDLMKSIIETGIADRPFNSLTSDELNNLARSYIKSLDAFKEKNPYGVYGDRERQDVMDYIGEYLNSGKIPEVITLAVESEVTPPVVEPVVETPVTTTTVPPVALQHRDEREANLANRILDAEVIEPVSTRVSDQAYYTKPPVETTTVTTPEVEKPLEETTASEVTIEGPEAEAFNWYNKNHSKDLMSVEDWNALSDVDRRKYLKRYKDSLRRDKGKTSVDDFNERLNLYNKYLPIEKEISSIGAKRVNLDENGRPLWTDLVGLSRIEGNNDIDKFYGNIADLTDEDRSTRGIYDYRQGRTSSLDRKEGVQLYGWNTDLNGKYVVDKNRISPNLTSLQAGNTEETYPIDLLGDLVYGTDEYTNALKSIQEDKDYTTQTDFVTKAIEDAQKEGGKLSPQMLRYLEYLDKNSNTTKKLFENGKLVDNAADLYERRRNDGKYGIYHYQYDLGEDSLANRYFYKDPESGNITYINKPGEGIKVATNPIVNKVGNVTYNDYEVDGSNLERTLTRLPNGNVWDVSNINNLSQWKALDKPVLEDPENTALGVKAKTNWVDYDSSPIAKDYSTESDSFPKLQEWPYWAAGLALLGALGYNILSPSDYSNANAMIKAGMQAGNYMPVSYTPRGNFHRFIPKDPWFFTSPIMAQSNATQRLLANKISPSKGAEQIANSYMNQLAIGNAMRQQLESNDADEFRKKEANNALGNTWSEGFLKADMANQDAFARAQGFSLEGQKAGYTMKQAIDDAKAAGINAGISGLIGLGNTYALNKYNQDVIKWQLEHNQYPISLMPDGRYKLNSGLKTDKDGYIISAEGGKIQRAKKNKRKGLNF